MNLNVVFTRAGVIPDFSRGHYIYWTVDPLFTAPLPYKFSVEVSQTSDFSEILGVLPVAGDNFFTYDRTNLKQNWGLGYHYRVILIDGSGARYSSTSINFRYTPTTQRKSAMALELLRKEFLLCRYAGVDGWLLKRKSYGRVSQMTVDPVSGVPLADEKTLDFGVGLQGGYFNPVGLSFIIDRGVSDRQMDPTGLGVKQTDDLSIRLPGYPLIDERDVICLNIEGRRFNVLAKGYTYSPGTSIIVYQNATLRLIPNTDTVYNIPIPLKQ